MADRRSEQVQPDPMLREGRSGAGWRWVIVAVIALALVVTFFAISSRHQVAEKHHATPITTGASDKPPATALPAGRGNAHAARTGEQTTIQ